MDQASQGKTPHLEGAEVSLYKDLSPTSPMELYNGDGGKEQSILILPRGGKINGHTRKQSCSLQVILYLNGLYKCCVSAR